MLTRCMSIRLADEIFPWRACLHDIHGAWMHRKGWAPSCRTHQRHRIWRYTPPRWMRNLGRFSWSSAENASRCDKPLAMPSLLESVFQMVNTPTRRQLVLDNLHQSGLSDQSLFSLEPQMSSILAVIVLSALINRLRLALQRQGCSRHEITSSHEWTIRFSESWSGCQSIIKSSIAPIKGLPTVVGVQKVDQTLIIAAKLCQYSKIYCKHHFTWWASVQEKAWVALQRHRLHTCCESKSHKNCILQPQ